LAAQSDLLPDQIAAVWRLCGTLTASLTRHLAGDCDADGDSDRVNIPGTHLPRCLVRHVLREEWCTRLSDLIERRLMLLYHPELSESGLRSVAELMVEEGILDAEQLEEEIDDCRHRLKSHFGREVARV
jgi:hypothetical protein